MQCYRSDISMSALPSVLKGQDNWTYFYPFTRSNVKCHLYMVKFQKELLQKNPRREEDVKEIATCAFRQFTDKNFKQLLAILFTTRESVW